MANKFKSASSVKTGKKFTEKRLKLDCSVHQVAETIYVNKHYLIAIEKGDYSTFPSEFFAKAYFKKYAQYLHINYEFPSVFEQQKESKHRKISSEIMFNASKMTWLKYIFMILGLATLVLMIYFFNKNYLNNEEDILNKSIQKLPENIEYEEDSSSKDIEFYDSIENSDSIITSDMSDKSSDLTIKMMTEEENMLVLEFFDECWIEVHLEENLIEAHFFNNGDKYSKEIISPFKIVVQNADFVKGAYNGEDIDFIGNANRLTRMSAINF